MKFKKNNLKYKLDNNWKKDKLNKVSHYIINKMLKSN